jgi:hypothetical protein
MKKTLVVISALLLCAFLATPAFAKEITVRGKLQKTVEPGGWVIVVEKKEYLILNARTFQKEKWFVEGALVEATGEIKSVMTTYMQGTPFEARLLRPFEPGESGKNSDTSRGLTRATISRELIRPAG